MFFLRESLWLSDFFPQPTWRSHPSTDFDAKWLKRPGFRNTCAFWGKTCNFLKPLTPRPPKPPKFAQFWSGQNFRSISRLTINQSIINNQYSFIKQHGRTHAQATWNTIIQYLEYTEVENELSVSSNNCHVIDIDGILEMTRSARVLVAVFIQLSN